MIRQKKFYLLLLSTFLGLFCLNFKQPTVVAKTTLTMGILQNDRPYSFTQKNKQQGFSIELAHKIAITTNNNIKFKSYSSQKELQNALRSGEIDFFVGDKANFSKNYQSTPAFLYPKNVLFTRHDAKAKNLDRLTKKKVGLLQTGSQTALLRELSLHPVTYSDQTKLLEALANGKIAAGILNDFTYYELLKNDPNLAKASSNADKTTRQAVLYRITDPNITASELSFITYRQPQLNTSLATALKKLKKDQTLADLSQKYFYKDLTLE